MKSKYKSENKRQVAANKTLNLWIENSILIIVLLLLFSIPQGCEKFVEIEAPNTNINASNVYENDATAISVLTGLYINMSKSSLSSNGLTSMSFLTGLSGDELTLYSGVTNDTYIGYYSNSLTSTNVGFPDFWSNLFQTIFVANSAIEGLEGSSGLTPAVKQQLLGEARFMRAFCYFYLVNLYGDVPLIISTDYTVNATLSRSPVKVVYKQIFTDLKEAADLLNTNYVDIDVLRTSLERVRPNKWAAKALMARCFLFDGDYESAEIQSTDVINNSSLYKLSPLNQIFTKASSEALWQLQPVNAGWNTEDARLYVLPSSGPSPDWPVYLSTDLITSFESGDERKDTWVGIYTDTIPNPDENYYYPNKYKVSTQFEPVTEYHTVLRLAEQYLIRAEARARRGNLSGATDDLNTIRIRAGLMGTTATTQAALLAAIEKERRVELFSEWGHRWTDIKRLGVINGIMDTIAPKKGGSWNANWAWYPIPATDIQRNSNLSQNKGY